VIDALLWTVARRRERATKSPLLERFGDRRVVLVTGHRRESFGAGLRSICGAIADLAARYPNVWFAYPVHLNPQVREPVERLLGGLPNVALLPPLDYPDFVALLDRATLAITDSGGIQEEAPSLGKPVLVTRRSTERPEAIEAGLAELVGTDRRRIVAAAARLLDGPAPRAPRLARNPFGDGRAAQRIVRLLLAGRWRSLASGDEPARPVITRRRAARSNSRRPAARRPARPTAGPGRST
jgi:UDP-N-acetylglucosamine 2-epimerase (non-hydrolysing)